MYNSRPCKNKYMTLDVKNLLRGLCAVVHIRVVCVFLKSSSVCIAVRWIIEHFYAWTTLRRPVPIDIAVMLYTHLVFSKHRGKKQKKKESPIVSQPQKSSLDRSLLLGKCDGLNDAKRDYAPRSLSHTHTKTFTQLIRLTTKNAKKSKLSVRKSQTFKRERRKNVYRRPQIY